MRRHRAQRRRAAVWYSWRRQHRHHASRPHVVQCAIDSAADCCTASFPEVGWSQSVREFVVGMRRIECCNEVSECPSRTDLAKRGPNGLSRERSISGMDTAGACRLDLPSTGSCGGDMDAQSRTRLSCCDSSVCSMLLYNFLSLPAALVV